MSQIPAPKSIELFSILININNNINTLDYIQRGLQTTGEKLFKLDLRKILEEEERKNMQPWNTMKLFTNYFWQITVLYVGQKFTQIWFLQVPIFDSLFTPLLTSVNWYSNIKLI